MRLHRAQERALIAQVMLDLISTVHHGRIGSGKGREADLVLVASVVLLGHVAGRKRTAAEVGRALGMPRVTAWRKLEELCRRGIVVRKGTRYKIVDAADFRYVDTSLAIIRRAGESKRTE